MMNTAIRTIGMISLLSAAEASCTSLLIAVLPPTSASAPGTACTASRTRSTVSNASVESGDDVKRALEVGDALGVALDLDAGRVDALDRGERRS